VNLNEIGTGTYICVWGCGAKLKIDVCRTVTSGPERDPKLFLFGDRSFRKYFGEAQMIYDEQNQFVVGYLLDRARNCAVDPTALTLVFGVGVDAEFDRFVKGFGLGGC